VSLCDVVEAVIKELPEQGENRAVWSGIADIGRNIGQDNGGAVHLDAVRGGVLVQFLPEQCQCVFVPLERLGKLLVRCVFALQLGYSGVDVSSISSMLQRGNNDGWVVERLIDDQVRDQSWIGV